MKKYIYLYLYAIYNILFCIWSWFAWSGVDNYYEATIDVWVFVSLMANIFLLTSFSKCRGFNANILFLSLSYLFLFGHVFVDFLNFDTVLKWDVRSFYSDIDKLHSGIYCLFSLNCFAIGSLFCGVKGDIELDLQYRSHRICFIGVSLFLIGIICSIIRYLPLIYATQQAGSYGSYTEAVKIGFVSVLALMLVPGVIYIVCSNVLPQRYNISIMMVAILSFLLVMIYSGSRKESVFSIVMLILLYIIRYKKLMSIRKTILCSVFSICFLDLIFVIRETRFDLGSVLLTYINSLSSFDFLKIIVGESLTEMGLTFYSIVNIFETVPVMFPYECGRTIVLSLFSLFPVGMIFSDVLANADSTLVINKYLGIPVGSSIIGDLYWNFGFVGGCFSSLLFGWCLSFIRKKVVLKQINFPFYFSIIYILLVGVRAGIFELIRPLGYFILLVVVINFIYYHKKY